MSDINDEEPAFPRDHRHDGHNGLTFRDYMAAKAMQAMLTNVNVAEAPNEKISEWAYEVADAMLRARSPRYDMVTCSQCGKGFGPGNEGFSDCRQHAGLAAKEV